MKRENFSKSYKYSLESDKWIGRAYKQTNVKSSSKLIDLLRWNHFVSGQVCRLFLDQFTYGNSVVCDLWQIFANTNMKLRYYYQLITSVDDFVRVSFNFLSSAQFPLCISQQTSNSIYGWKESLLDCCFYEFFDLHNVMNEFLRFPLEININMSIPQST